MCLPWPGSSLWSRSLKVRMLLVLCLASATDGWPADALRILTQWGDQLWYLQKSVAFDSLNRLVIDTLEQTSTLPLGHFPLVPLDQRRGMSLSLIPLCTVPAKAESLCIRPCFLVLSESSPRDTPNTLSFAFSEWLLLKVCCCPVGFVITVSQN